MLGIDYAGGYVFAAALALAAAIGGWELYLMLRRGDFRPIVVLGLPTTIAFAPLPLLVTPVFRWWVGLLVLLLLASGIYGLAPRSDRQIVVDWALTLVPVLLVGLLLGHLGLLRLAHKGAWWVFTVLLVTWAYDSGAYFAGSAVGRRPFMRHISPKKTLEGVVGGLVLSAIASVVAVFTIGLRPWQAIPLGLVLGAAGQAGDLMESLIKRQVGVKDSGNLIPGHGGLLDRVDSLLVTGAVGYYAAVLLGYAT